MVLVAIVTITYQIYWNISPTQEIMIYLNTIFDGKRGNVKKKCYLKNRRYGLWSQAQISELEQIIKLQTWIKISVFLACVCVYMHAQTHNFKAFFFKAASHSVVLVGWSKTLYGCPPTHRDPSTPAFEILNNGTFEVNWEALQVYTLWKVSYSLESPNPRHHSLLTVSHTQKKDIPRCSIDMKESGSVIQRDP